MSTLIGQTQLSQIPHESYYFVKKKGRIEKLGQRLKLHTAVEEVVAFLKYYLGLSYQYDR